MMKQPDACVDKSDAVLIARQRNIRVPRRAARVRDVADATLRRAEDVVSEGEKSIRRERASTLLGEPRGTLFLQRELINIQKVFLNATVRTWPYRSKRDLCAKRLKFDPQPGQIDPNQKANSY